MGRPTDYTPELGDEICEAIANKIALAKFCNSDERLPAVRTVYGWIRKHPEFMHNYENAKEDQADYMADDCLEIADNPALEPADKRIRVDTRKWLSSKFKPKKYGDRNTTEHVGSLSLTSMSDEELDAKIKSLTQGD